MRNKNKQLLIANVHPLRLCSTILFQISKVLLIRPFPAEREKNKLWGSWERKYNCAYTNGWHVIFAHVTDLRIKCYARISPHFFNKVLNWRPFPAIDEKPKHSHTFVFSKNPDETFFVIWSFLSKLSTAVETTYRCTVTYSPPVAYAEIFHGEVHSVAYGGRLYLVCAFCDVWRHILVFKLTFWWSLLTWYAYSSTRNQFGLQAEGSYRTLCLSFFISYTQVRFRTARPIRIWRGNWDIATCFVSGILEKHA